MQLAHTVDEALAKFTLIAGIGGPADPNDPDSGGEGCVMSLMSWIAGESWSDNPECAHKLLRRMAIRANDASGTTPEQRAELVRAGATGLIDTWWVPDAVVLSEFSKQDREAPYFDQVLGTVRGVGEWKAGQHDRPDLSGSNLRYSDLSGSDLSGSNLRGSDLRGSDLLGSNLSGSDLSGSDLRGSDLSGSNLRGSDLRGSDLSGSNLRGSDLRGSNLRGSNLSYSDLRGSDLRGSDLRGSNLLGSNLSYSDLSVGVTANALTIWPDGFDFKAAGVVV